MLYIVALKTSLLNFWQATIKMIGMWYMLSKGTNILFHASTAIEHHKVFHVFRRDSYNLGDHPIFVGTFIIILDFGDGVTFDFAKICFTPDEYTT